MEKIGFLKILLQKKIVLAVIVAVVLICVLSLRDESVADKIDLNEVISLPEYGVQDLKTWGQGTVQLDKEPLNMEECRIYIYKLDGDALEEYISMLEDNGFTLVDEHHQSSFLGSYQSYGLLCDAASEIPTIGMMYTDTSCHVNIWKMDSKWRVEVANGLHHCDLGLRRDGTEASVYPAGGSLCTGLLRTAAGQYKTSDGRFKTKVGEAEIRMDGNVLRVESDWKLTRGRIVITVEISKTLTAKFSISEDAAEQGAVFLPGTVDEESAAITLMNGKKEISANQTGKAAFRWVSMRIMHMGEDGTLVVYLHAQPMDTESFPEEIELLCAINTTPEKAENQQGSGSGGENWWDDDEPFRPDHSKLDCFSCGGDGNCSTCGGDGYTGFGDATAGCRSCHGNGNCTSCGGSGKR